MTEKQPDPFKECRRVLTIGVIVLGAVFLWYEGLPLAMDLLGASASADGQPLLQPSTWETPDVDPLNESFSTLVMSGTYAATAGEFSPAASGDFEIIVSGADMYFRREWKRRMSGWRWKVEMGLTNFYGERASQWRGYGYGGGGSHGFYAREKLLVGRRLWDGNHFVGAVSNALRVTSLKPFDIGETEIFSKVERVGPYLIPREIVFEGFDKRRFTYHVTTIRFRNDPGASWFGEKKAKMFGRVSDEVIPQKTSE